LPLSSDLLILLFPLMRKTAKQNIKIQWRINFMAGVVFLVPVITLFYKYTGLSLFKIILVSNIFTFGMWLFELPTSVLADTMGRKKSLVYSVITNFIFALIIFIYPSFIGFCIAAVFQALYYSFWSGTGQAFLQENLNILGEEEKFGRVIGGFMFYEQVATIATPLVASFMLKTFGDSWYTILAGMDVFFAIILVILTMKLTETTKIKHQFKSFKEAIQENIKTAKIALQNVFGSKKLKLFLLYRSLSHHVLFFGIVLLPLLSTNGMEDRFSGVIKTVFVLWSMFASKYVYKIGEKRWYNYPRVLSTIAQWICLVLAWIFFKSRIIIAIIYFFFSVFDGFIWPAWNHSLVELTKKWKTLATTRSIIFAMFALYMTIGKQILSFIPINYAFILLGGVILITNLFLGTKIINLQWN